MLRLYSALLWLLPCDFRAEYGREMRTVVAEHWQQTRSRSLAQRARFWIRQVAALIAAAWTARTSRRTSLPGHRLDRQEGRRPMEGWTKDLRISLRGLLMRPGFTLVTVCTLALGIGASTATFSAVYAVLLRALPYDDADRIVTVFHEDLETGSLGGGLSAINARDLGEASRHLSAVAVADPYSLDLQVEGRAESLRTWAVTEGFFRAAGVGAMIGRTFTPEEYLEGAEAVVVVGYRSWRARFGGDPELVGSVLTLDDAPVTVVGILPPEFKLPDEKELWIPRPIQPWDANARAADYMLGVARLADGSSIADARSEAAAIAAALREEYPQAMGSTGFRVVPLREHLFGAVRTPMLVLLGAVAFVMLIACANVAGLMLARGTERQREYALRSALGASAARLVRQVAIDSALMAGIGCALGIGVTFLGVRGIRALAPVGMPRLEEIAVDGNVLAFALAAAGLSALLSGLAPSLRFSRPDLRASLGDGGRGTTARGGRTLRAGIVVVEVALAMVLLVGAGLLTRSFGTLLDRDLGFDPGGRLALQLFAYGYGEAGGLTRADFVDRTVEEMEAVPGVRAVALTSNLPGATDGVLASIDIDLPFTIVDRDPPPVGQEPEAQVTMISDGYLDVMSIPLVAGRALGVGDHADAPDVVLVNETFARRHFPDDEPVGRRIRVLSGQQPAEVEVVGVVGDVLPRGYESAPRPELYFSMRQQPTGSLTYVVATERGGGEIAGALREAIWRVNPSQSIWGTTSLDALLGDWLETRRFNLALLGAFATIALALAGIGIYGLISFSIEQRVGEMGVRRALGGQSSAIVGMVLREAGALAVVGVVVGLAGALALGRFIRGMLVGVDGTDPLTLATLSATVLAVAALAAVVPALRATRVDPVVALRSE